MRVLVVEDEARVRSFVKRGLREAGFAVDDTESGEEGLQLALMHTYDAVVLDLMLPGRSGLEIVAELRRSGCATPVLILTAREGVQDRVRGLDAGADDYLPKPFAFEELLARLRALMRRGTAQASVIEIADLRVDLLARKVQRQGVKIDLTQKEFALLEYLARHSGQVVTRTMIAEHVWDMNFDSFTNVIDVYIRYLRRKIDDPFEPKLIHTRRGVGYVLAAEP
jgi:two-component system, OmpR family, copper resistance phosphate regulon response regulator CusR